MSVSDFALATLGQVKDALGISGASTVRDRFLERTIERVSMEIESGLKRQIVARDYEEDIDGTGTGTLYLDNYPILNIATMIDDTDREFTNAVDIIKPNSRIIRSEEGIIRLWNETGRSARGRSNIRIHYHAGYANLHIEWKKNRSDFRERATGTAYAVNIAPGVHDVFTVASLITRSMNSLGLNTYQVRYDTKARIPRIRRTGGVTATLQILASSGANATKSILPSLGFGTASNLTGATGYAPTTPIRPRVPLDIEQVAIDMVVERYDLSDYGGRRGIKSEKIGEYSITYTDSSIPQASRRVLEKYQKFLIY